MNAKNNNHCQRQVVKNYISANNKQVKDCEKINGNAQNYH